MMMLEQFTVENFKAFKSLTLDDLGHINIFVGDNNVGKTCLLQALFIANNFDNIDKKNIRNDLESAAYIWSGAFLYPACKNYDLITFFHKLNENLNIKLSLFSNNKVMEPLNIKYLDKDLKHEGFSTISVPSYLKKEEYEQYVSNSCYFHQGNLFAEIYPSPSISERLNTIPLTSYTYFPSNFDTLDYSFILYEKLKRNKNTKAVISILKNSIEPRLENIEILGTDLYCDLGFSFDTLLPISLMGDGFIKLFSIALALTTSTNCVFLDEPENGFHYKTQTSFWKLLANWSLEGDKQSFIATHSYELISCLNDLLTADPTLMERGLKVRVHQLKRDEDNPELITVDTIDQEGLEWLLEHGTEIR